MSYNVIADKIEIRSITENNKPRYLVNAIGAIANKKHIYEYIKKPDGTNKTLKSMFTPHCIQSIKDQSKSRRLFIDTQHELVRDASIKAIVKDKLSDDEFKRIGNMLNNKKLPLAKINDIDIEDENLHIYTEFNSAFRDIDDDHKNYFDAVWSSLENKYLNGVSINFGDMTYALDDNGDTVIDDIEVLGFSFLDAPAETANSIYEVAIRSIEEGIHIREGVKMEEEKKQFEAEKAKFEEEKKKLNNEKAELEKTKSEAVKQEELRKQEAEQAKINKDLEDKATQLKKLEEEKTKLQDELTRVKGVAAQTPPPAQSNNMQSTKNEQFYADKLKEISAPHRETMDTYKRGQLPLVDNTMKGFSELVNLQAQAKNYTADLDTESADGIKKSRLLDRTRADIVAPRSKT